jgi:5'-deoxynucleotidase YfbR-like HD superfamily hydrolase
MQALRQAGHIKRLHTVQTVGAHTLQRHVYGAQILALGLLRACPRANPANVLETLLLHDAPEVYTGDIPAPVKRAHPILQAALDNMERDWYGMNDIVMPALTELEANIVKSADYLDLGWACIEEARLGNKGMLQVFENVSSYLFEFEEKVPGLTKMINDMEKAWEVARE